MLLKTQLLAVPAEPKFYPDALLTSDTILRVKPCLDPALTSISTLLSQTASDAWV